MPTSTFSLSTPITSMTSKKMLETQIKIEINEYGDATRKITVQESFEDDVTLGDLTDVFNDALRAAGYFPDGK